MKIISVVGARPQFIKLAVLSQKLRKKHRELILHTGQHYDDKLSKIFFKELKIPRPDFNLGIGSGNHGQQTSRMLEGIEKILLKRHPDLVIVYGDTNSTLAGALAAAKLKIPLAHVEAGLRSYRKTMPEEINRVVSDHLSDLLFCPTRTAVENLKREGITKGIYLVGDVMYDSVLQNLKIARKKSSVMNVLALKPKEFHLVTIHRAENTDDHKNLKKIVNILVSIRGKVIFPAHPRLRKSVKRYNLFKKLQSKKDLALIDPVSYWDMLILEESARFILTDSGGVQKEAFFLKTPCITLREETEWIETVKKGMNKVTGLNLRKIKRILKGDPPLKTIGSGQFGNGRSSQKISSIISRKTRA
ncbi:MAG: UDP-N-acetylglucosamine 2-epimerase (non-hydrolyzing) [Candidatus Zixiibacteriota bacterium]